MVARGTQIVRPIAHSKGGFGRNQPLVASPFYRLAQNFFRLAPRVDVCRVEQIYAGFEANIHKPGGFGGVTISPCAKKLSASAKRTRAEAQNRHFQSRISQLSVFHDL